MLCLCPRRFQELDQCCLQRDGGGLGTPSGAGCEGRGLSSGWEELGRQCGGGGLGEPYSRGQRAERRGRYGLAQARKSRAAVQPPLQTDPSCACMEVRAEKGGHEFGESEQEKCLHVGNYKSDHQLRNAIKPNSASLL